MKEPWLDRIDPKRRRNKRTVIFGFRELTREEANDWLLEPIAPRPQVVQ